MVDYLYGRIYGWGTQSRALMDLLEMNTREKSLCNQGTTYPNERIIGKRKVMLDSSEGPDSSFSTKVRPGDKRDWK